MIKFFALLFAAIGLLLLGVGLLLAREHPAMLALALAGAVVTYFAFGLDRRRERAAAERHDKEMESRIDALEKMPWKNGRSLDVKRGKSDVSIAAMVLAVSVFLAYASVSGTTTKWGVFAGSVLFSVFALFGLLRMLPGIGKPALVLNIRGLQTPLHGFIPWREVSGVNLQQTKLRGSTISTLSFHVENYAGVVENIHWTERMLWFFGLGVQKRKVVSMLLNGVSEDPQVIGSIAKHLWQQSTDMTHEWNPLLSNEFNNAARRSSEFMRRHKDPSAIFEDILKDPENAVKEAEQFRKDLDTIESERRRTMRRLNWMVAISTLGIVAAVIWPFIRSHFLR